MRVTTELTIYLDAGDVKWHLKDSAYVYVPSQIKYHVETGSVVVYANRQFNNGGHAVNAKPFFYNTMDGLPLEIRKCIVRNTVSEKAAEQLS